MYIQFFSSVFFFTNYVKFEINFFLFGALLLDHKWTIQYSCGLFATFYQIYLFLFAMSALHLAYQKQSVPKELKSLTDAPDIVFMLLVLLYERFKFCWSCLYNSHNYTDYQNILKKGFMNFETFTIQRL